MNYAFSKEWDEITSMLPNELAKHYNNFKRTSEILTVEPQPLVYQTPKQVIWTKNKATLYRFAPAKEKTKNVPLLIFYALINKPYILDLAPGNSFIEYLTNQGFDVYMMDWGTPSFEDRHMTFDDYIMDYMPKAVKKVLRHSSANEISLMGYCMGGTMTSIFASLHTNLPIKNIVFLTTPTSFEGTGLFSNWLNKKYFNVDKLVDAVGNVPPEMIDYGNKMLRPLTNFTGPYTSLFERADSDKFVESWQLMQKWVADGIPFPGGVFRQWIKDFYMDNKLIKGELTIQGQTVSLGNITANVLNVGASNDHIAQPKQLEPMMNIISSKDKTFELIPAGHVSVIFGKTALKTTYPMISEWLTKRSN